MWRIYDMLHPMIKTDIVIFGAGIAGLWAFHRLSKMGYSTLLLEKESIGCGQTIAAQGIIHSGLKFSLAGKVNKLAQTLSTMPDIWRAALSGKGNIDLSSAKINAPSQNLLIPKGFMGGLTTLIADKALGHKAHTIKQDDWPENIKNAAFTGSIIFMDEPVIDVPTLLRALAAPYKDNIKKITAEESDAPFEFLKTHKIEAKRIIFTSAAGNHEIAKTHNHDKTLQTQKRPLMQGIIKNAPFPLYAHFVGKTDKPVASITTHKTQDGTLIWYVGGGIAERPHDTDPKDIHTAMMKDFKTYLPNVDLSQNPWAVLPINRIEGKSKTENWMPDTPTIHRADNALYCWPTKLTFAPMLANMIIDNVQQSNIMPSHEQPDFSFLQNTEYAQTPWDKAKWIE